MRAQRLMLLFGFTLAAPRMASGQSSVKWRVFGDTVRAPYGCSATAAIRAIDTWFAAFNAADSAGLAGTLAKGFVINTGKHWVAGDSARRFDHDISAFIAYVRERRRHHETLVLDSVRFYGWMDGAELGFMPYYRRTAADLGPRPISGLGKSGYLCDRGIRNLNLAPVTQQVAPPSNEELK